jgi:2-polyprenyl-6-methoxyphenol hydroxylase-like FAD-dependent oxidoreductase
MTQTDVVIVGAGPTGLMLAVELALAGVRPLVFERRQEIGTVAKAGGLSGHVLQFLRHRDLGERVKAEASGPFGASKLPFGGLHIDFAPLDQSPVQVLPLPQEQLQRLLEDHAKELGAEVRRGCEVVGLAQSNEEATVQFHGPDGPRQLSTRYLVGCDGVRSRVRELAGIPFPGEVYPEVNRLVATTMPAAVAVREDGDFDIPALGRVRAGFTRTERGEFAISSHKPGELGLYTSEDEGEGGDYDDNTAMTLAEFQESVRRVLGAPIPLGEPRRLTRFAFGARHAQRYRDGRILLAGDAAHQFPAPGVALGVGLLDAVNLGWKLAGVVAGWASDALLDTYHDERRLIGERTMLHTQAQVALRRGHDPAAVALRELFSELVCDEQPLRRLGAMIAGSDIHYGRPDSESHVLNGAFAPSLDGLPELMRAARPVFLDLADRPELRQIARPWADRVDIHVAEAQDRPADALLIRPDVHVAWAAAVDESAESAAFSLREALTRWFGDPSPQPRRTGAA